MEEKLLKSSEVREILNVSNMTLYRLDRDGKLCPFKRTSRSKRYKYSDVLKYMESNLEELKEKRLKIAYARVSSNKQKNELQNQILHLENYASGRGIIIDRYIKDVGSGINYNNKGLNEIIDLITGNKVDELILSYKDRLVRFGFEIIENIARKYGTKITVINLESTSPEKEIVDDLLAVITVFSDRVHGLRSYKSKIKESISNENSKD